MLAESHLGGVRRLVRQGALSHTDWLGLIEARRALIEPHLNTMELTTIGKVKVAGFSGSTCCMIEADKPEVVSHDPGLTLDTRCWVPRRGGLYGDSIVSHLSHRFDPPGSSPAVGCTDTFWALTRSGRWIIITAQVQYPDRRQSCGRLDKSKVFKLEIRQVSVPDILSQTETTPKDVWLQLGKLAEHWYRRRQSLLSDAQRLTEAFQFEEQLLNYVERR